jgi:hypothetical protein
MLEAYAALVVGAICLARRAFPGGVEFPPHPSLQKRDYEWTAKHECDNCGRKTRHTFIEWLPERVVTATCGRCGFEGTL